MENKRNHNQIYITVVTSGLTMLANKVSRVLQPNEDIFDACSELANEIAKENGLNWSNVLVQYFNHYSDEIPAMALKVPAKPKSTRELALEWWSNLSTWGNPSKEYYIGLYYSDDTITDERIEEIWRKENPIITKGLDLNGNVVIEKHYTNSPKVKGNIQIRPNQKQDSFTKERNTLKRIANATGLKPNQKQFKEFNPDLFKSYIGKFSDEDKLKALKILNGYNLDQMVRAYSCGYGDRDADLPQFHGNRPIDYIKQL
jgi:hypothetical protein